MQTYERPALACGIVYAIAQLLATAFFVTVIGPHLPDLGAPLSDQQAFYVEFHDLNALVSFLFVVPVIFFVPFLAGLTPTLKRLEGPDAPGVLSMLAMIGGAALVMLWPMGIVIATAGQSQAAAGLDPATVITFDAIAQLALGLAGIPRAMVLFAVSLGLLRSDATLRKLGIAGQALGIVALVSVATMLHPAVYIAAALDSLLFGFWVAALAAVLLARLAAAPRTARVAHDPGRAQYAS